MLRVAAGPGQYQLGKHFATSASRELTEWRASDLATRPRRRHDCEVRMIRCPADNGRRITSSSGTMRP
jgi:hypothetical protein